MKNFFRFFFKNNSQSVSSIHTWNTLALNPNAASMEMFNHEGGVEDLSFTIDKSAINVLDLLVLFLIFAGGWTSLLFSAGPCRVCLSLDFSRIERRDFTTQSRVGA